MSARQFVAVKFRSSDAKAWTYHWDGTPVACGDVVKVPPRFGSGWQRAVVHAITDEAPAFETKPILGVVDEAASKAELRDYTEATRSGLAGPDLFESGPFE